MERTTQHTPGPWTTSGLPATPDTIHWPIGAYAEGGVQPVLIATCYPIHDDGQPGGECAANARLIAAAPDLLAACEELVTVADAEYDTAGDALHALHAIEDILHGHIIPAIKAAKGESV